MLDSFRFHHIGIATGNIQKTAKYYLETGYEMSDVVFDPLQQVNIVFLSKEGMPKLELLEPVSETSPVSRTLEKSGVSPYHICYSVVHIDEAVRELKKKKFVLLFRPIEAIALDSKKICFLFNQEVGLIELLEE